MGFHDARGYYHQHRAMIRLSIHDFREVTAAGAVGALAVAGGVLASDTSPIMGAEATTESMRLHWAAANADIIQTTVSLPPDFNGRDDVLLELDVLTDNAGGGGIEAATFNVLTSWDNGAQVADTATDSVPAITMHTVTARIAAADIPDGARLLNLQLFPGTHANDPVRLLGGRLTYVRDLAA